MCQLRTPQRVGDAAGGQRGRPVGRRAGQCVGPSVRLGQPGWSVGDVTTEERSTPDNDWRAAEQPSNGTAAAGRTPPSMSQAN